jgi:hypothetical protein
MGTIAVEVINAILKKGRDFVFNLVIFILAF